MVPGLDYATTSKRSAPGRFSEGAFSLGSGDIRLAGALHLGLAGLNAVRRVNPWILFATPIGTLLLTPGNDSLEDHSEDEFLRRVPPISSSISGCSTLAPTPRDRAQYGSRAERVSEATLLKLAFECTTDIGSRLSESEDDLDIMRTLTCSGARVRPQWARIPITQTTALHLSCRASGSSSRPATVRTLHLLALVLESSADCGLYNPSSSTARSHTSSYAPVFPGPSGFDISPDARPCRSFE